MNLLNVLLKVLLADAAIKALSGKTGLSSSSLKKLLPLAIPLLLRYMTNNASSQSGALSLLGALTQHSNFRSAEEMLAEADEEDGGKIVQHILGDDTNRAVEMLAEETNLSSGEVNRGLNGLAPVLLTVLASAMLSANNQSSSAQQGGALDLSNLLNVFGGSSVQQPVQQSSGGLLGSLLGGNSAPAQNGSLLSALLGGSQPQQPVQQTSATGSLLNALLGGGTTVAQQPAQQASVGGSLSPKSPQSLHSRRFSRFSRLLRCLPAAAFWMPFSGSVPLQLRPSRLFSRVQITSTAIICSAFCLAPCSKSGFTELTVRSCRRSFFKTYETKSLQLCS